MPPWPGWPKSWLSRFSGLTVDLHTLAHPDVWIPGLVLAVALTVVIRPLGVGACLIPVRLQHNERVFILLAGLKGAVPILLGEFLRAAHVPDAERLYGIVVVVVAFSVLVQGSSVPGLARLLRLPMRTVDPEPWAIAVRLRDEPHGVHRLTVASGSPAEGWTVEDLGDHAGDIWVSMVVRTSGLVPVRADTELHAGDEVVILADPELRRHAYRSILQLVSRRGGNRARTRVGTASSSDRLRAAPGPAGGSVSAMQRAAAGRRSPGCRLVSPRCSQLCARSFGRHGDDCELRASRQFCDAEKS